MQSFTRNYHDNSTDAGFQFTFYCDNCSDGYKSSFLESETYKKGKGIRAITQGASIFGGLMGGRGHNAGWAAERGGNVLEERFQGQSPEWQKEHERAFEMAQNEAMGHFHRCHSCSKYACDACYNQDAGLCIACAPREDVYVAKAHSTAMQRNIDETAQTATVWHGNLEQKTTVCPGCGHPAGTGQFCNNCGQSLAQNTCPGCGQTNAPGTRFCNHCGTNLQAPPPGHCAKCGTDNAPGGRFCGGCGAPLG